MVASSMNAGEPASGFAAKYGKLRILAAADLHGVWRVYEWLAELTQRDTDVLVLAGDLLESNFAAGQRKQAKRIVGLLRGLSIPVLYLMGNDDNVSLDYEDDKVRSVHGRRVELGGFSFVGYQYSPPFVGDVFVKPEPQIEADLKELEPLLDRQTVLVTHTPAFGSVDLTFGREHAGSPSVAGLLKRRPVLAHIHGHIHESFGRDGNHFNVASAGVCRTMRIELPSLRCEVLDVRARAKE